MSTKSPSDLNVNQGIASDQSKDILLKELEQLRTRCTLLEAALQQSEIIMRAFRYSMDTIKPFPSLESLNRAIETARKALQSKL